VLELAQRLSSNFTFIQIEGFDEVLRDAAKQLIGRDSFSQTHARSDVGQRSFDERICLGATLDDLDLDLALVSLTTYCEHLRRAPLTRDAVLSLLREQGLLLTNACGKDEVTYGAILLFGRNTQQFVPQAVVTVTEQGKKREVYDGNLLSQRKRLLEKVESTDVNPVVRLKKRGSHEEQPAYHQRALVELLVNLLVHGDYEVQRSANIDIQPGIQIAFKNPGGLTPKMTQLVSVDSDGKIGIAAGATDSRNVSLSDIFFGLRVMERAGTGLADVNKLMIEAGGESAFFHNQHEETFSAIVRQAATTAGSKLVAHSTHPTGVYVLNMLPIVSLPTKVSIVRLTAKLWESMTSIDLEYCGVFIARSFEDTHEFWSFAPLDKLLRVLAPIAARRQVIQFPAQKSRKMRTSAGPSRGCSVNT
jgi:Putative ATP-dependent DNA helicase recG C-terminal